MKPAARAMVGVNCVWQFHVGGNSMWVAIPCGWQFHVGGNSMWVAIPCGWQFHVGGNSMEVKIIPVHLGARGKLFGGNEGMA